MSQEENPFAELVIADEPTSRRKRAAGPLLTGLAAALLATYFMGPVGFASSLIAVGCWWAFKFWPRPVAPDVPEARAFLQNLEGVRPDEVDFIPQKPAESPPSFEDLRL